jgi:hypothetical protein
MNYENLYLEIDDKEADDLYGDLISLEVGMDDRLASMFKIRLPLRQEEEGEWSYLDDKRFTVWKPVVIQAGFDDGLELLISGYITHVRPQFEPDSCHSILEVWGMDKSVLMDREEKLKVWANKKDSDIASEIFSSYGFKPSVKETGVIHEEAVSTIVQRETDRHFLDRLALRNGFYCYVEGKTGVFRPPKLKGKPQPALAAHFGEETTLNRFRTEVNGLVPSQVGMYQLDRVKKNILEANAVGGSQAPLGARRAESYLPAGSKPSMSYIGMSAATGKPEMDILCNSFFHRAEWFVTAHGEVAGNLYGHVLKPRATVTIKGVGETYSGLYYVDHVTHSFTGDGYLQFFKAKRNALMPTGAEVF